MSALALDRESIRNYSATWAPWLAVALAVTIPLSNSLTTIVSILLVFVCILQMDRATWGTVLKHPITIPILALVVLSLVDISYTVANQKEITLAIRKITRLLYFPLLLPIFTQFKWRQYAYVGFLGAMYLSIVVAVIDGWAIFKDTIFTSLFAAFGIFMLAHISMEYKRYRFLTIPLALFFTFYLLFVGIGRTGQILLIMLFGLFLLQRLALTFKQLAAALGILFAVFTIIALVPSSFMTRQKLALQEVQEYIRSDELTIPHSSSMGTRLVLVHNTWELIKMKPIFGWGTGSFPVVYAKFAPETQIKRVLRVNPHNQYLLTQVELGLPGLLCLLWLFFTAAWVFMRSKQIEGYLGLGLVLSFMAGCCMNSWLLDCTSAFFLVFFMAVLAGGLSGHDKPGGTV